MKIPDSRTLPFAAALVALTMAPAASAATPMYREIKDWVVACDNTARCEAIGMQEAYPQLILRLVVDAGPSGEPELSLESEAPVAARDLRLDGARFAASSLLQPATGDEGVQRIGHDGVQVRAFLDAVRNGTQLRAGIGEDAPSASLAGLSAALLLIDETQGRLGTTTALIRRGPLPAAQVPAAQAAPLPTRAVVAPPLDDAEASRLVARVRLQALRRYLPVSQNRLEKDDIAGYPEEILFPKDLEYRPVGKFDEDLSAAMQKMSEIESLAGSLPALDCGSCGAPTCRAFAEDVVLGGRSVDECIVYMRERIQKLANDPEEEQT